MPAPRGRGGASSLIEHLNAQAPTKPVRSSLGIRNYYHSADLLLRQATSYRQSHNEEQLYVMLMRFASLLIETIPQHNDFNKADSKYTQLRKFLQDKVFPELETIKLSLRTRDAPEPIARSSNRPTDIVKLSTSNLPQLNWASVSPGPPPPPAFNVDDLLDYMSPGRTGPAAAAAAAAGAGAGAGAAGQQALSVVPSYQPKYTLQRPGDNNHMLFYSSSGSSSMYARPAMGQSTLSTTSTSGSSSAGGFGTQLPRYPTLDQYGASLQQGAGSVLDPMSLTESQRLALQAQAMPAPSAGPPLGPQEVEVMSMSSHLHPGPPGSCSDPHPAAPGPAPPDVPPTPVPGGPKELTKRAALRDVHISVAMMEEFLRFAASNTARGIETCGILAARLAANDSVFTVSTLIIPKQKGTSDTVEMLSEEDVLMVHLEKELYPLGWIHTHPTQTCFLSSVDVHTQCSYQTMLDEAVAIVMAPSDRAKKCGIFRLTTPGGLQLVQKCDRRGFHMHPETSTGQELYELCGHVYLNDRVKHEVVDLR